jgi:hypothetical protein
MRELLRINLRSARGCLLKEQFQRFWDYRSDLWAKKFLARWTTRAMRSIGQADDAALALEIRVDAARETPGRVIERQPLGRLQGCLELSNAVLASHPPKAIDDFCDGYGRGRQTIRPALFELRTPGRTSDRRLSGSSAIRPITRSCQSRACLRRTAPRAPTFSNPDLPR